MKQMGNYDVAPLGGGGGGESTNTHGRAPSYKTALLPGFKPGSHFLLVIYAPETLRKMADFSNFKVDKSSFEDAQRTILWVYESKGMRDLPLRDTIRIADFSWKCLSASSNKYV